MRSMTIPPSCIYPFIGLKMEDFILVVHSGECLPVAKVMVLARKSSPEPLLDSLNLLRLDRSVNIPWPEKGMGDADYLYAFQKLVMPIAYEFAPDLVISKNL